MRTNYDDIISDKERLGRILSENESFVSQIVSSWWCVKGCPYVNECDEDCLYDAPNLEIVMKWLDQPCETE